MSLHLMLDNGSDTICNDTPSTIQYCLLLISPNQSSQDVTQPGTTLAESYLTATLSRIRTPAGDPHELVHAPPSHAG